MRAAQHAGARSLTLPAPAWWSACGPRWSTPCLHHEQSHRGDWQARSAGEVGRRYRAARAAAAAAAAVKSRRELACWLPALRSCPIQRAEPLVGRQRPSPGAGKLGGGPCKLAPCCSPGPGCSPFLSSTPTSRALMTHSASSGTGCRGRPIGALPLQRELASGRESQARGIGGRSRELAAADGTSSEASPGMSLPGKSAARSL